MNRLWIWIACLMWISAAPARAQDPATSGTAASEQHDHDHDHTHDHDHDHAHADEAPRFAEHAEPIQVEPWDKATLETFARLPIQDGGRIKPLSTFARFELIKFSGRGSLRLEDGRRISAMEWLLHALFHPELAAEFRVLRIENPAVMQDLHLEFFRIEALRTDSLDAAKQLKVTLEARKQYAVALEEAPGGGYRVMLGRFATPEAAEAARTALAAQNIATQGVLKITADEMMKRGAFTFLEIAAHEDALEAKARDYSQIDSKQRSLLQNQVLTLYSNYAELDSIFRSFDFARLRYPVAPDGAIAADLKAAGVEPASGAQGLSITYSQLLTILPQLTAPFRSGQSPEQLLNDPATAAATTERVQALRTLELTARDSTRLSIMPAAGLQGDPTWLSPGTLYSRALPGAEDLSAQLAWVRQAEALFAQAADHPALTTAAAALEQSLRTSAEQRGEYPKIGLEIFFYKLKTWLFNPWLFTLAFLVVTLTWMFPRSQGLARTAWFALLVPTLLLIFGITLRCIIRGRPPISTLYETTLFIPAVAILLGLIVEKFDRRRIALSVCAVLGVAGLFLANKYELSEGADTMNSLVAVLDSNFWLSTHVTTVTMGYSAGLLAAALAHVYLLGRLFGIKRNDPVFYKSVVRMTYGVICFGLFFSFVGTVLGGIWANYSWGRFWGWDPKENGALLIIIWELMILHGRLGGYFRNIGLCAMSILLGIIVSFSWWGVNMLGVGLHSYGFMEGGWAKLSAIWAVELLVALSGVILWYREMRQESVAPSGSTSPGGA